MGSNWYDDPRLEDFDTGDTLMDIDDLETLDDSDIYLETLDIDEELSFGTDLDMDVYVSVQDTGALF